MSKKTSEGKAGYKDCLTSELLLKHFPSQFDLVRHAIQLAGRKVEEEKDMMYPSDDARNLATESLEDIAENGRDSFIECSEEEECCMEEEEEEEEVKPKSKRKAKA
jgi:hypothetical protein